MITRCILFLLALMGSFILTFALAQNSVVEPTQDLHSFLNDVVKNEVSKECSSCSVDIQIHNPQSVDDIAIPDKVILRYSY